MTRVLCSFPCSDCTRVTTVRADGDGEWADSDHDPTCPVYRDAPGMRAVFEDELDARLHADYGNGVVVTHTAAAS